MYLATLVIGLFVLTALLLVDHHDHFTEPRRLIFSFAGFFLIVMAVIPIISFGVGLGNINTIAGAIGRDQLTIPTQVGVTLINAYELALGALYLRKALKS